MSQKPAPRQSDTTGPGETNPQVPLRERIARAIFVHADHCRCGSGVIDPACITAKEDAVLAEVQTELDERHKVLCGWVDSCRELDAKNQALQAENVEMHRRYDCGHTECFWVKDENDSLQAQLLALQDKCKKLAERWSKWQVNGKGWALNEDEADILNACRDELREALK